MASVLVLGAQAGMIQSTLSGFAESGARLCLVGRRAERLNAIRDHLVAIGAKEVTIIVADLGDMKALPGVVEQAFSQVGAFDIVLVAYGTLGDQLVDEHSPVEVAKQVAVNFVSPATVLTDVANRLEAQKHGTIAVISSVAGDRARRSNYIYGSAKSALSAFVTGLRYRLMASGVSVVLIKPGFVDTPMTEHCSKGFMWASSEQAGRSIYNAIIRKKTVAYVPSFWRYIMAVIRLIPDVVFRRMKI